MGKRLRSKDLQVGWWEKRKKTQCGEIALFRRKDASSWDSIKGTEVQAEMYL